MNSLLEVFIVRVCMLVNLRLKIIEKLSPEKQWHTDATVITQRKTWIERPTNFTAEKWFSFCSMTIFSNQLRYLDRIASFSAYYISAFFFWSYYPVDFPKIWQQQKRSNMIVFNHIKNQGKEREFVLIEPDHSTSSCSKQGHFSKFYQMKPKWDEVPSILLPTL